MRSTFIIILLLSFGIVIQGLAKDKKPNKKIGTTDCLAHDTIVQVVVETSAKFQDGDLAKFKSYVMSNLRYPLESITNGYSGKSLIRFVVGWDGHVKDVTTYKSSGYKTLDDEAVRVVKRSPLWTSAKNNNICVPQQFVLPVAFVSLGVVNSIPDLPPVP